MHRWRVGQVDIVRIEDEDFALPSPRPVPPWAVPDLAPTRDQVGVAFSAFALADADRRLVVDPWLANDFPRSAADADARVERLLADLDAAGFPADSVDTVVNTHFDGVGWNTRPSPGSPDGWTATFPHARYLYPRAELEAWRDGRHPTGDSGFGPLERQGQLEAVDPPQSLTPDIRLVDAPGHADGHLAVRVESGGSLAVIPGHLFLTPFQVADPTEAADVDPTVATRTRRSLLDDLADHDGLLLTNLLGGPGGGVVRRQGSAYALRT